MHSISVMFVSEENSTLSWVLFAIQINTANVNGLLSGENVLYDALNQTPIQHHYNTVL